MSQINCNTCEALINADSIFCSNCGIKIRCSSCDALLNANAKFCSKCGIKVSAETRENQNQANTVKYRRTRDEVFCDVSLSNEVGKEGIIGLIQGLTSNQNISYKRLNGANSSHEEITAVEEVEEEVVPASEQTFKENSKTAKTSQEFPHISDLEMNLNCTEGTWILIYAFYESDYAKKTFTKDAVYKKYMAKRKTAQRIKNFSSNWKGVFKRYFATVNDKEIKFKPDDLDKLKNIILGKNQAFSKPARRLSSSKKKKEGADTKENQIKEPTKTVAKKVTSNSQSYALETDLNLHPDGKQSLKHFYDQYDCKINPETVLVIVYYLQKIIGHAAISENTIYTCYKNLHLPVPNIRQTLNNVHSRKGWINTADFFDLKVTVAGENHIEHEIAKK